MFVSFSSLREKQYHLQMTEKKLYIPDSLKQKANFKVHVETLESFL